MERGVWAQLQRGTKLAIKELQQMPSVYGEVGKDQFQTPPTDVNLVPNILPVQTNIAISAHDLGGTKSVIS